MTVTYPPAHLLGLPVELREFIYDYLTADGEILHLKDDRGALHLSTAYAPPLSLLQTHSALHREALVHFYRTSGLTLHVDTWAFAKLQDPNDYITTLQSCHYLTHARNLELRLTMNAHVDFLAQAVKLTVPLLLSHCKELKTVTVTWAETVQYLMQRSWRPWAYKSPALEPLWDLAGKVEIKCGGVINAPPATAELQERGLKRSLDAILKYKALSEGSDAFS
jgi:hypothetical protein